MFNNLEQTIPIRTGGHAIIYPVNKDPHVLLLQRNGGPFNDLWEFPGGSVENCGVKIPLDDTTAFLEKIKPEHKRELKEETDFDFPESLIGFFPHRYRFLTNNLTGMVLGPENSLRRFIPLYTCFNSGIPHQVPIVNISSEHKGYQWVPIEGSIQLPLTQITGYLLKSLSISIYNDDQTSMPGLSRFSKEYFPNGFEIMR